MTKNKRKKKKDSMTENIDKYNYNPMTYISYFSILNELLVSVVKNMTCFITFSLKAKMTFPLDINYKKILNAYHDIIQ